MAVPVGPGPNTASQNWGRFYPPLLLTPLVLSELRQGPFQTLPSQQVQGLSLSGSALQSVPGIQDRGAQRDVGKLLSRGRSWGLGAHRSTSPASVFPSVKRTS